MAIFSPSIVKLLSRLYTELVQSSPWIKPYLPGYYLSVPLSSDSKMNLSEFKYIIQVKLVKHNTQVHN